MKLDHAFQQQVYALVRRIPLGKVLTYKSIADLLGYPRHARAVGWALRNLPSDPNHPDRDVPWHRVINSKRELSVFWQESLNEQHTRLTAEGVHFDKAGRVSRSIVWQPSLWEVRELLGITPPTSEHE